MPTNFWQRSMLAVTMVVLLAPSAVARADGSEDAAVRESHADASASEQARAVARRFEARLPDTTDADGIIPPIARPLLLFGDDPRNHTRGILWGWGSGRPVAVAELWRGRAEDSPYAASLTLTGLDLVAFTRDEISQWKPAKKQVQFSKLADAPSVAAKENVRLRQSKEIARRMEAHEFWDPDNSRFELRLLIQPVHRYSDSAVEIQDGIMFVFAHGTNPEALLLIEAVGPTIEKSSWQYGLVRTSNAEVHAELDGKEVWMQPRVKGGSTRPADSYFVFSLPSAANRLPAAAGDRPDR
jgi:hypothetical protein